MNVNDLSLPPRRPDYGAALVEPVRERDWTDDAMDMICHPKTVQAALTLLGLAVVYVGMHLLARLL